MIVPQSLQRLTIRSVLTKLSNLLNYFFPQDFPQRCIAVLADRQFVVLADILVVVLVDRLVVVLVDRLVEVLVDRQVVDSVVVGSFDANHRLQDNDNHLENDSVLLIAHYVQYVIHLLLESIDTIDLVVYLDLDWINELDEFKD